MRTQIGTQITVEKKAGNLRAYPKTALDVFFRFNLLFLQVTPTLQLELYLLRLLNRLTVKLIRK